MIKHLLYILWARKRKNALMIVEIGFSFLILFLLFTTLYKKYENYSRPNGFETKNIMAIRMDADVQDENEINEIFDGINTYLKSNEKVNQFAEIDYSHPYSNSYNTERIHVDSVETQWFASQYVTIETIDLMDFNFVKGRNFVDTDHKKGYKTMIVNQKLYDKMKPYLNDQDEISNKYSKVKIIGVIDHYNKENDFEDEMNIGLIYYSRNNSHQPVVFIKTDNDPRTIEAEVVNGLEKIHPKLRLSVDYLENMQDSKNKAELIPLFIMTFICLFLVINITTGLYGVLWYNISKRKSEIGIRRAMGASTNAIFQQIFSEVFLLFIIGVFVGSLFAVQFPLTGAFNYALEDYFMGGVLSLCFVLFITIICGYYPSKLAMKITPNEALQEL